MRKLFVLFLCFALIAAFAAAEQGADDSVAGGGEGQLVGNDRDEHGCIGSAGYTWCEDKQKCLRLWEEDCADIIVEQIGGTVDEHGCGNSMGEFWCEDTQKCFRIHQEECASFEFAEETEPVEIEESETEESGENGKGKGQAPTPEGTAENMPNRIRLAAQALLSIEERAGGIGKNISAIAREFDNSVQAAQAAENKIQKRTWLARLLTGGDEAAAEELEKEVGNNNIRIQALKQLAADCNCTSEIKTMMQEQVQNMELEQARLSLLAAKEKGSKGLFGWLWK